MTGLPATPPGSLFPSLGECRNCFMPCGACPDQIRAEIDKARHNRANLEACIIRRTQLEEVLREIIAHPVISEGEFPDDNCDWHCVVEIQQLARMALGEDLS